MSIEITDEMLQNAARKTRQAMLDSLPADEDCICEFSPAFEARMNKLLVKARRQHYIGKYAQRVAAVMLAALVGLSAWLAVDPEARAVTLQWLREIYENSIIYHFFGELSTEFTAMYEPYWLPDGYIKTSENQEGNIHFIDYGSEDGDVILFTYYPMSDGTQHQLISAGEITGEPVIVKGCSGNFYTSSDQTETNDLVWLDDDIGIIFVISSTLDKEVILEISESVALK